MTLRFFYAVVLTFSLMSGKTCLASTSPAQWKAELQGLRDAHARQDARGLAVLERAAAANFGSLANHPLRIQAEYWHLSALLTTERPRAEAVRKFISSQAGTRQAEQLRREWLKVLGKSQSWPEFGPQYARFTGDDMELGCYAWQERLQRHDKAVAGEALSLWNSDNSAPESCDEVFRTSLGPSLGADEIWRRQRKLLELSSYAELKRISAWLPAATQISERELQQATRSSLRFLQRQKIDAKSRASIELALHAIRRHARIDAVSMARWLNEKGAALPSDARRQAWAEVATQAAQQHDDRASEWFAEVGDVALPEAQAAWRVRAALRVRDWVAVEGAINAMSVLQKREGAWRYWLGRAHAAQGRKAAAEAVWATITREAGYYYALLAAEELGKLAAPAWDSWQPKAVELELMRANPALQRSLMFYEAGLPLEGLHEWRWAMRGLDDRQLLAASQVAEEAGVLDRALNAAERTVAEHDFSRRFPLPFREHLEPAAEDQDLDVAWVYGLVRQESAFISEVRSSAGAIGLMQLMPTTAKWIAGKANLRNYHTSQLAKVETNLLLGTLYLKRVLDDLADPVMATAAYNAGPSRAKRWRAAGPLEGAIYAETIPFTETRDYVKRVMANAWLYSSRLGNPKPSLKAMLGTVPGRDGNSIAALAVNTER